MPNIAFALKVREQQSQQVRKTNYICADVCLYSYVESVLHDSPYS